ncbi:helix-turn-helix domain-containing protein [Eubacteriaceae bacterium ES2]|nr:helix-turn-helix domain-containing protein [Eubacteriaceae bacterium ES2]
MRSMLQPYFVLSTEKYLKSVINQFGISHFYSFTKNAHNQQEIIAVPDGCIDILFTCDERNPLAEICGSVLHPQAVLDQSTTYFGVRFYPGQWLMNGELNIREIIGQQISLLEIFDAKKVFETIVTSNDFNVQVSAFLDFHLSVLKRSDTKFNQYELKDHLLKRIIESKGQVRVGKLAKEVGYSERSINLKFIDYFGISPKVLNKIIRFQHVLFELNQNSRNSNQNSLINIAQDAGYFDQSHMYKDFNEFSSISPGHYMDLLKKNHYDDRLVLV